MTSISEQAIEARERTNGQSGDRPVRKFRVGNVTAAVWKNEGQNGSVMSVTLQKSYKDGNEEWQNTDTLFHGDILNAIKALERAEAYIAR